MSYLSHLVCTDCGRTHAADALVNICACGGCLFACYDVGRLKSEVTREQISDGPATLWRYAPFLPVEKAENVVSQNEGWTPLHHAERLGRALGLDALWVKNEGVNPTGTFKDRGASVGLSRARELGAAHVVLNSSGNAGVAWSSYAARGGAACSVLLPHDAPAGAVRQCALFGARVFTLDGHWSESGRMVFEAAGAHGWHYVNTMREPYRVEGKKTMGLEICEQLGWKLPDVIFYPTGGGLGVVAIYKAIAELREMGWVEGPDPRLVVTQYKGCAPIVRAFERGEEHVETWGEIDIIPGGLKSPNPAGGLHVLRLIRMTNGSAVALGKEETLLAVEELARHEGILACPEGATTLAGLKRALEDGVVRPDERVVLMNTGSGLRYSDALSAAGVTTLSARDEIPA